MRGSCTPGWRSSLGSSCRQSGVGVCEFAREAALVEGIGTLARRDTRHTDIQMPAGREGPRRRGRPHDARSLLPHATRPAGAPNSATRQYGGPPKYGEIRVCLAW